MTAVANVHINPCVVFFNVHLDFLPFISSLMIGVVKIFIEKMGKVESKTKNLEN